MTDRDKMLMDNRIIVDVCGPEDFKGYYRNKPNDEWELVRLPSGTMCWTSKSALDRDKPRFCQICRQRHTRDEGCY